MITIVRNKKAKSQVPTPITTLGDLHRFIETCDLPATRKAEIRSAIKRVDALVGHGALDLAAEPAKVFASLSRYSPAMAGMSTGGFANFKSRLRTAFRIASPHLVSTRSVKLSGDWLALDAQLAVGEKRQLSRFLRYACVAGWEPGEVGDSHLERFTTYLREDAMIVQWEKTARDTIRAWNRTAAQIEQPALQVLTPPAPKRTSYWLDPASLPESLQADIRAFLAHLEKPSVFAGHSRRLLKPNTVKQYGHAIITVVSALAETGEDVSTMTSLADVMTAPKVEKALHFLHERFDHHVTRGMGTIAARARKIASWTELSAEALSELDDLIERLDEAAPAVRGLTVKNKALLDRLDDPQFRDLIYVLPKILMKKAARTRRPDAAATLARAAIAIELLLTCSMRRANLISLKLEHNIRRIGAGSNVRWVIEFEGVEVKNGQVLRYELPKESGQLLEDYLHNWRPALCTTASPWLFPAPDGSCMDARHLAGDISRKSERELGVPVTPHQFRHISAELYLRDNPDKLSVISEHLGHRDPNTTRMYYARPKQREASRMYQERLGLNRSRAAGRTRQRPQRNVAGNGFDVIRRAKLTP